jgi:uncharacterized SAM-binding protein YcdF (DUF218 family)
LLGSRGSGALIDDGDAEAKFAARLLESLGIARSRITLEDRSRNTLENAVFSKAIVQPKPGERCLLVTSAYHMPRAIGVFRKAGFPVEPYPVDWRTVGREIVNLVGLRVLRDTDEVCRIRHVAVM